MFSGGIERSQWHEMGQFGILYKSFIDIMDCEVKFV